ncbi:hypothetical protein [Shinella sp. G-2]|uniref:hypothetical protein n=1 Tax=Shinella sp. G-2 TaxID=3133141 RepID=UPI003D06572F
MLPRVATTTGTAQPSPALEGRVAVDAAVKPQLSAAALANLKAEVLLRLLETMLKHMPRTAEPSPGRDLLETLLGALKALPGRDGDNAGRLADIIARLPPALRPSVEKLISTVLSAMPTRSLIEIVRNPNGPEAQKLATLIATGLDLDGPVAGAERQAKPVSLTAQQLAAVGRQGAQQSALALQTSQMPGDARALQATLKRIFDFDTGGRPRPLPGRAAEAGADRQMPAGTARAASEARPTQIEPLLPTPATRAASPQQAVDASEAAARHNGAAEEARTETPAVKREALPLKAQDTNTAGQALARSVLQAVARDLPPALLTQAVVQLVENLSPEEATFLRTLLEHPFDPAIEQEIALIVREHVDEAAEEFLKPETGSEARKTRPDGLPAGMQPATAEDGDVPLAKGDTPALAGETARAKPDATQTASIPSQPAVEQEEPLPLPRSRDAAAPIVDATPERLLAAPVLREGVPVAFVPYLPAEEDLEWPQSREPEKDEETDGDNEDEGGEADEDAQDAPADDEPETADMARRREKTAEMVGVLEPGLVFYQKLGDYWT